MRGAREEVRSEGEWGPNHEGHCTHDKDFGFCSDRDEQRRDVIYLRLYRNHHPGDNL